MSDPTPSDDTQHRRKFLQLIGASSVAGSIGTAAADHKRDRDRDDDHDHGTGPSVDLFTFAENYCHPEICDDVDYLLPVGAEAEFQAIVSGNYSVADVKKKDLNTGYTEIIESCDDYVEDCESFTVEFDQPGKFEIRYEAWKDGGVFPGKGKGGKGGFSTLSHREDDDDDYDGGRGDRGGRGGQSDPCEQFEDVGCNSVSFKIVDPTVSLTVEGFDSKRPFQVADPLIFTAELDPHIEVDDWELETLKVDDEPAQVPEHRTPRGVKKWARLPVDNGTYIATATATIAGQSFSKSIEVEINPRGEFAYSNATIETYDHYPELVGSVDLNNNSYKGKTANLVLKTFGNGQTTVDSQEVYVGAGRQESVSLKGKLPSDAFYVVLSLNGESIESTRL